MRIPIRIPNHVLYHKAKKSEPVIQSVKQTYYEQGYIYLYHKMMNIICILQVFTSLRTSQLHIPYRNSKLTQILQPSLGGDAKVGTFMIFQINYIQNNCNVD